MAYITTQCGGLKINTNSLQMINGVVTDKNATTVTNSFTASCGGQNFDSAYFKNIGQTISANGATTVANSFQANCSLLFDSSKFQLDTDGAIEYKQVTLTINATLTTATITVVDWNDDTVQPNEDGTYTVMVTKEYTYTVTNDGYTTQTDSVVITGDLELDITLEPTPEP